MSKIILAADIHLGLHGRLDDTIWAMGKIREYARNNNISNIVILGDLFHDRVSIKIDVLSKTYQFLEDSSDLEWLVFPGNHDMVLRHSWDINSLKPLCSLLTVIEDIKLVKICGARFWIIPFIHYEEIFMKVLSRIETKYEDGDVLLTHVGVNGASLNECFLLKNWNTINFTDSKFDRVYTGHFHCHQQVGENVWYPGSILPYRFDEGIVDHGFLVYDTTSRTHEFIKIFEIGDQTDSPPDFITITDDDLNDINAGNDHIRIYLSREYTYNEKQSIRSKLIESGARSVHWLQPKEYVNDTTITVKNITNNDMSLLFKKWIEHDDPKKFDKELLTSINADILTNAHDRFVDEISVEE